MRTPSFPSLHTTFSLHSSLINIRSSFRRNSSSASRNSYASTASDLSAAPSSFSTTSSSSPLHAINTIMSRQPSMLDLAAERASFGSGLEILEPRPVVYWGSMEERLESL